MAEFKISDCFLEVGEPIDARGFLRYLRLVAFAIFGWHVCKRALREPSRMESISRPWGWWAWLADGSFCAVLEHSDSCLVSQWPDGPCDSRDPLRLGEVALAALVGHPLRVALDAVDPTVAVIRISLMHPAGVQRAQTRGRNFGTATATTRELGYVAIAARPARAAGFVAVAPERDTNAFADNRFPPSANSHSTLVVAPTSRCLPVSLEPRHNVSPTEEPPGLMND